MLSQIMCLVVAFNLQHQAPVQKPQQTKTLITVHNIKPSIETVIAYGLLFGQVKDIKDYKVLFYNPWIRFNLMKFAFDAEILDERETRYVLTRAEDFESDLKMLQWRYKELTDAPFISDSFRFPDRTVVSELLVSNRGYRNYLEMRKPMELANFWWFHDAMSETDQLYQIWDLVRDARCEYYYVTVRRSALKKLRDLLGDDSYYEGYLPPYVPLWRFARID